MVTKKAVKKVADKRIVYLCGESYSQDDDLYVEWTRGDAEQYPYYFEIRLPRAQTKGKCLGVLEI